MGFYGTIGLSDIDDLTYGFALDPSFEASIMTEKNK
jgi:hypothetical protein